MSSAFQSNCSVTPAFLYICSSFAQLCHNSPRPPKQSPNSLGRPIGSFTVHSLASAASGLPLRLFLSHTLFLTPAEAHAKPPRVMLSLSSLPSHQLISLPHTSFYFTCPNFPPQTHHLGGASWKIPGRLLPGVTMGTEVPCGEGPTSEFHSGSLRKAVVMEEGCSCERNRERPPGTCWLSAGLLGAIPLLPDYTGPT